MEIWGGENLEISFKIWMCGGELVCAPCSHVGHVYRETTPYSTTTVDDVNYLLLNSIRLAEVWLDDYKRLFYERVHYDARGDLINVDERRSLRRKLKCKSFEWYLQNVYPDLNVPRPSFFYGEVGYHEAAKLFRSK
jgi:polypeptide N-acetylgalactosaminyltransferase